MIKEILFSTVQKIIFSSKLASIFLINKSKPSLVGLLSQKCTWDSVEEKTPLASGVTCNPL